MIAPQELRIGNLVKYVDDGEIKVINGSAIKYLENAQRLFQLFPFEPIELTEEWLLKMGFDLLHKGKFRNVYDYSLDHRFGYSDNHGLVYVDSALTFVGNSFSHIKFVHQLQNLVFALTGEELTIKEQS
ncbi:hypothetical protein [Chryseobacterium sp.]|uniref:hypothetical protein n=1 Tax=Chryseobacterium sp. TaxID=1871047 RepID=UPI002898C2D5|nr:hypothetical protein [Chryseobacterium sp.]